MDQIEPNVLKSLLDAGANVALIDVREPEEHELVRISGSQLVPLMTITERLDELRSALTDPALEAKVVYCRSGGRSASAIEWLESQGVHGLVNLRGGINAYAREADSSLCPY